MDDENVLLIACYEKPYSDKALSIIRGTIKKENPTKIIILKIIEEPSISERIDARVGKKTKSDFLDSVMDDKKRQVDEYTEDILDITDETDIPTEVRMRKAETIADEIIEDYEKMEVDHLIIHDMDKDLLERLGSKEVEEGVKEEIDRKKVTSLE